MTDQAIRADQRVGEVARDYPGALEVMTGLGINHCCADYHPHFRQLRNALLRRVMAPRVSVAQAARMAGVAPEDLLAVLRRAVGDAEPPRPGASDTAAAEPVPAEERPAALCRLPDARLLQVDVREDIRRGEEPFARIMAGVRALGPDQVLVLRAPFEPIPLYDVLGKRGLAHWTERHAPDDWSVWFYRGGGAGAGAATPAEAGGAGADPVRVIDVRGLEPPQPMVRVLVTIAGMMLKIVPFLVWYRVYAPRAGRHPVPTLAQLTSPAAEGTAYALVVAGIVLVAAALAAAHPAFIRAAGVVLALGAVAFAATLAHVLRHLASGRAAPVAVAARAR